MGDLARPHRFTPRRRLILYLLSARLVIGALPFLRFGFCTGRSSVRRSMTGADHGLGPSTFPAVEAAAYRGTGGGLSNYPPPAQVNRSNMALVADRAWSVGNAEEEEFLPRMNANA